VVYLVAEVCSDLVGVTHPFYNLLGVEWRVSVVLVDAE